MALAATVLAVAPVAAQDTDVDDDIDTADDVIWVTAVPRQEVEPARLGAVDDSSPQILSTASAYFDIAESLDAMPGPTIGEGTPGFFVHRPANYDYYPEAGSFAVHQMEVQLAADWATSGQNLEFAVFYKRDDVPGVEVPPPDPGAGAYQVGTVVWDGESWDSLVGLNNEGTMELFQNAYEAWIVPIGGDRIVVSHVFADSTFNPTFTASWSDGVDPSTFGFATVIGEAPGMENPITTITDEIRAALPTDWILVPGEPITEQPTNEVVGSEGSGSDDGDDGGFNVILVLIPIVIAGVVFLFVVRVRRKGGGPPAPVAAPPEPAHPCDCGLTVEISGPRAFRVCCMKPELTLREAFQNTQVHLDADVRDRHGWDLFDAMYTAVATPSCTGEGEVLLDEAVYRWHLTGESDTGFTLHVRAAAPARCAHGELDNVVAHASYEVIYEDAPCIIRVLIQRDTGLSVSHVDVHIMCGTYSEVFGFFAIEEDRGIEAIAGVPGEVGRHRSNRVGVTTGQQRLTTGVDDGIGAAYEISHAEKALEVWEIGPVDCTVCEALRNEWELLAASPGTYWLTENNCATQAYQTLFTAGAIPRGDMRTITPTAMSERLRKLHRDSSAPWPIAEPYHIDPPPSAGD